MNIAVNLTDKQTQNYSPSMKSTTTTKPPVVPFSGPGMKLNKDTTANFVIEGTAKQVDMNQPTVNIKIRFFDGKQKVYKINKDWTVNDVYRLARDESGISAFKLMQMPKKILEPSDLNVVETKVANSSLIQQK